MICAAGGLRDSNEASNERSSFRIGVFMTLGLIVLIFVSNDFLRGDLVAELLPDDSDRIAFVGVVVVSAGAVEARDRPSEVRGEVTGAAGGGHSAAGSGFRRASMSAAFSGVITEGVCRLILFVGTRARELFAQIVSRQCFHARYNGSR